MILYIKHIDIEGPGTLGTFFNSRGYKSKIVELFHGSKLPDNLDGIDAVISLGGPMNVYEEDKYPALIQENLFIQNVLNKKVPFLGICLGSQLLAKAMGGKVVKSLQEEIGFFKIDITTEGLSDRLFKDVQSTADVFQWHGDMSELPNGATLLASSIDCPQQAFRVGENAYGLQFHIEITDKSIIDWTDNYIKMHQKNKDMKKVMLREYETQKKVFNNVAYQIYENFLSIIEEARIQAKC